MTTKALVIDASINVSAFARPAPAPSSYKTKWLENDGYGKTPVPMNMMAVRSNPFLLRNGFPYVPPMWVNLDTLVSSDGTYLSGDRDDPFDVDIKMFARFIASDSTWDGTAFKWYPAASLGAGYSFEGAPLTSPVLEEIEYRVGRQIFHMQALAFQPGLFLTSKFNDNLDDAIQYSIGMVVIMETPGPYGLFAGPHVQGQDDRWEIFLDDEGTQLGFAVNKKLSKTTQKDPVAGRTFRPIYICLSVGPEKAALWVGTSPKKCEATVITANALSTPMIFTLGNDWMNQKLARFHLLEFGLWDHALSNASEPLTIMELFSAWSSIYGNADE